MKIKDLLAHSAVEGVVSKLEAFSDEFERLARTPQQKALAAEFKRFAGEMIEPWFPNALQSAPHREALWAELLEDVEQTIATGGKLEPLAGGGWQRVGFEALPQEGKPEFLAICIDHTGYVNKGLEPADIDRVIENVVAGKHRDKWLEGVSVTHEQRRPDRGKEKADGVEMGR